MNFARVGGFGDTVVFTLLFSGRNGRIVAKNDLLLVLTATSQTHSFQEWMNIRTND